MGIPLSSDASVQDTKAVRWTAWWGAQRRWLWPLVSSLLGLLDLVELWGMLLEVAHMNKLAHWTALPR